MPGIPKLILGRSGIQDEYQGIFGRKRGSKAGMPQLQHYGGCYTATYLLRSKWDHVILIPFTLYSFALHTDWRCRMWFSPSWICIIPCQASLGLRWEHDSNCSIALYLITSSRIRNLIQTRL